MSLWFHRKEARDLANRWAFDLIVIVAIDFLSRFLFLLSYASLKKKNFVRGLFICESILT